MVLGGTTDRRSPSIGSNAKATKSSTEHTLRHRDRVHMVKRRERFVAALATCSWVTPFCVCISMALIVKQLG